MNGRLKIGISGALEMRNASMLEPVTTEHALECEWIRASAPGELIRHNHADIEAWEATELPFPMDKDLTIAALIKSASAHPRQCAVLCRSERADMRGLFHSLDVRNAYGKVWLVGAGPGAADLITVRAQRILSKAEVIYYDDLVDENILAACPGDKRYVGKRKGRASHAQDQINHALYASALEGKTVARLKGGDPSIFGRAGEELDYLRRRWIRVEVAPGVTSASAAAAMALVSLTQRGISKSVQFLSAHGIDNNRQNGDDRQTFVYYMASSRLKELSHDLLSRGILPQTPAALVHHAGFWDETCALSTVAQLPDLQAEAPALVIVGNTAAFACVEKKTLYTGMRLSGDRMFASVVHHPLIEREEASHSPGNASDALSFRIADPNPAPLNLAFFSSVIFTCPLTIRAFQDLYGHVPDHMLCYVSDQESLDLLVSRGVHPWSIVLLPSGSM